MRKILLSAISVLICLPLMAATFRLLPESPKRYTPLPSELLLNTTDLTPMDIVPSDDYIANIIKVFRLSGQKGPFYSNSGRSFLLDTVSANHIGIWMADNSDALDNISTAEEDVMRIDIGVLMRKSKRPIGIIDCTYAPGGVRTSNLYFFDMRHIDSMRDEYMTQDSLAKILATRIAETVDPDSTMLEIYNRAVEVGVLDSVSSEVEALDIHIIDTLEMIDTHKVIKLPQTADFFRVPKGDAGRQLRQDIAAIPFAMISYEMSPADLSLTARLSLDGIVSLELAEELKPHLIPSLHYIWDGSHYRLQKAR